jgi:hypothetical protein
MKIEWKHCLKAKMLILKDLIFAIDAKKVEEKLEVAHGEMQKMEEARKKIKEALKRIE